MPRQARLDAPGTLHQVLVRGIGRTAIFHDDTDRVDFLARLAALAEPGPLTVYAWALRPNHAHLLVQTGRPPLAASLRKLLTGFVVNFNRRHRRVGHLFQNRGRSSVVGAAPYRLELVRASSGIPAARRSCRPSAPSPGTPGPATAPSSGPSPGPGRRRARSSASSPGRPAGPAGPTAPSWWPGARKAGAPSSKAGGWCAAWAGGPP